MLLAAARKPRDGASATSAGEILDAAAGEEDSASTADDDADTYDANHQLVNADDED